MRTTPAVRFGLRRRRLGIHDESARTAAPTVVPISDVHAEKRIESSLNRAHGMAEKTKLAQARKPSAVASARSSERAVRRNRPKTRKAASSAIIPDAVSIVACKGVLR